MPVSSILSQRIMGRPLANPPRPKIGMGGVRAYADGGMTDDPGTTDPYAYDYSDDVMGPPGTTSDSDNYDAMKNDRLASRWAMSSGRYGDMSGPPKGDQGVANDSGMARPTSSGNVHGADPLSTVPLKFPFDGSSTATDPVSRYQDMLTHPDAAHPKSSFWRRLGGALVDTAGTWAAGFGVPRGITHHLAQDVRYGPDAAHAQEDYYQNLPLARDAATFAQHQQTIDQTGVNQRLIQQQRNDSLQERRENQAETARTNQEKLPGMQYAMDQPQDLSLPGSGGGFSPPPAMPAPAAPARPPGMVGPIAPPPEPSESDQLNYQLPMRQTTVPGATIPGASMIPQGYRAQQLIKTPTRPGGTVYVPPKNVSTQMDLEAKGSVVSEDMANQLAEIGIKGVAPGPVDPKIFDAYQSVLKQQVKEPPLAKDVAQRTDVADKLGLKGRDRTAYIATGKFAEYPPSYTVKVGGSALDDKRALQQAINQAFEQAGGDWRKVAENARSGNVNPAYSADIFDHAEKLSKLPGPAATRFTSAEATQLQAQKAVDDIKQFVASHPEMIGSGFKDPITGITRWFKTKAGIEPPEIGAVDSALESVAALQPGLHGFRSLQSEVSFKHSLGIDPRTGKADGSRAWLVNPDKAISAIQDGLVDFNQTLKNSIERANGMAPTPVAKLGNMGQGRGRPSGGPAIGTVQDGYSFKGGDPADKKNWEPTTAK